MAEYPIIMKQKNDQGEYDTLYPQTLGSQIQGTIPSSQITGSFPATSITYNNSQTQNIITGESVQEAVDETCQYFTSAMSDVELPIGIIAIWSGTTTNIPTKWHLCDGTNGTPDLRGQFVVGAGGSYNVGDSGGEAIHTLAVNEMPSHSHNLSLNTSNLNIGSAGAHIHTIGRHTGGGFSTNASGMTSSSGPSDISTNSSGSHTHTISGNITYTMYNTGGSQPHNNLPPYYALCYIMKIA